MNEEQLIKEFRLIMSQKKIKILHIANKAGVSRHTLHRYMRDGIPDGGRNRKIRVNALINVKAAVTAYRIINGR